MLRHRCWQVRQQPNPRVYHDQCQDNVASSPRRPHGSIRHCVQTVDRFTCCPLLLLQFCFRRSSSGYKLDIDATALGRQQLGGHQGGGLVQRLCDLLSHIGRSALVRRIAPRYIPGGPSCTTTLVASTTKKHRRKQQPLQWQQGNVTRNIGEGHLRTPAV